MSSCSSSDSSLVDLLYCKEKNGIHNSVSATRENQDEALEKFFLPDPLSFCHFSFDNVVWKPKPSLFKMKRKEEKHNPLFALIEEEERVLSRSIQSTISVTTEPSITSTSSSVIVSVEPNPSVDKKALEESQWIIKHVSGYATSGEMTAILGASGAGKTTLLSILCGRNSNFTGDFRINGKEVSASSLRKVCRFVRQHDLFYEYLTVEEHLYYQAILRIGDRPYEEIQNRLVWIVKNFNLSKCLQVQLGGVHVKGISGGEMRRVTLATELINYPSILFCDEPTSGLDSYMAETVIRTLRKLADQGVTVICTIHQPPTETYSLFDRVMYLADGEVAFFGRRDEAMEYFKSVGLSCPPYYNMADYAIHTLAIDSELNEEQRTKRLQEVHFLCEQFKSCSIHMVNQSTAHTVPEKCLDQSIVEEIESIESFEKRSILYKFWKTMFLQKCPTSWWVQFKTLLSRNGRVFLLFSSYLQLLIRDPSLSVARLFETLVLSVLVGLVFLRLGYGQSDISNRLSVIFMVMMNECFALLFAEIQVFPAELPIIYNEVASGLYRVDVYYLAKTIIGIPLSILFPLLGACINYFMIGLDASMSRFVGYVGILWLVTNSTVALGHFISALTGDLALANAFSGLIILPLVLLGGFYLQDHPIPGFLIWIKQISMFNWGYKLMVINQFSGKAFECPPMPSPCLFPDGAAVLQYTGVKTSDIALSICILVALNLAFRIGAFICLEIHTYLHLCKL